MRRGKRSIFLSAAGASLAFAILGAATLHAQTTPTTSRRVRLVATANQNGPVAYRDPIGVLSPDGAWLATGVNGWVRVSSAAGGALRTLGPRSAVIRFMTWLPDSRHLAVLAADSSVERWWMLDATTSERRPLWAQPFPAPVVGAPTVDPRAFRQVAWSPDGGRVAGVVNQPGGSLLYVGAADGNNATVQSSSARLSYPAWAPDGKTIACLMMADGRQRVSLPCGTAPAASDTMQAWGPIAFSADGTVLYFASPNARGTLDLWTRTVRGGGASQRITNFARDSYAPSVARDGRVVFGTQDYRVFLAVVPAGGGATRTLTAFQSETPNWSPDDKMISTTYGSWRRIVDDAQYPDIAQDIGLVRSDVTVPATAPASVVRASKSEDQGMDWSPNGRWVVLHSHADGLDDVWIQPADGSRAATPASRGGHETGWPRWSPDGGWIAYSSQIREGSAWRGVIMTAGVDSAAGAVTREARQLPLTGFDGDVDQVEWSSTGDSIVFNASHGLDVRAIYVVSRNGGTPRMVHRFASDQNFSGLGVSPDFKWVAFIAPAADGRFQVFRVPIVGGSATQVTFDPTDKTQPSVSHDGTRIAFTVLTYQMQFWSLEP